MMTEEVVESEVTPTIGKEEGVAEGESRSSQHPTGRLHRK
ncbi:hypothetical protein A2U01_0112670, partial [Trifolium medium]|nr:hypothetical protein [Trifolium medium]